MEEKKYKIKIYVHRKCLKNDINRVTKPQNRSYRFLLFRAIFALDGQYVVIWFFTVVMRRTYEGNVKRGMKPTW